jgi:repressor LexA
MTGIREYVDQYYLKNHHSPAFSQIANEFQISKSTAYKYIQIMNSRGMIYYNSETGIETDFTRRVSSGNVTAAVLGGIACGLPNFADACVEEYVSLPEKIFGSGEFYILKARGNSMIKAGVDDGDCIVIRKQDTADEGDIVVALVGDETTLKRLFLDKKKKKYILHPENSAMEDIIVDECTIQGVLVKILKDPK